MTKTELRKLAKQTRAAIPAKMREAFSNDICYAIINSEYFKQSKAIMAYMAFGEEVSLNAVIHHCLTQGKQLVLPRVDKAKGDIIPHLVSDINHLVPGAFGILEPKPDAPCIEADKLDLVLVPMLAFDGSCNRLGWGAGYYDRFLPHCKNAQKWGVAFAQQEVANVLANSFDVMLDRIYTQDKIFYKATEA